MNTTNSDNPFDGGEGCYVPCHAPPLGEEVENYFGGCPVCGGTDGYVNVSRDHWFVCDVHQTKWYIGSNLFSCWREEDEACWEKNRVMLSGYTEVDSIRYLRDRQSSVVPKGIA